LIEGSVDQTIRYHCVLIENCVCVAVTVNVSLFMLLD